MNKVIIMIGSLFFFTILILSSCDAIIHLNGMSGLITTVAGNGMNGYSGDDIPATSSRLNYPYSITVDSMGNLFIADTGNNRIRKVDKNGIITTVAGNGTQGFSGDNGPASAAILNKPNDVVIDEIGNLYLADTLNNRIRKIDNNGIITTVAGNGTQGFSGDGGQAISARLYWPAGITIDTAGNIYIGDTYNNRIRKVDGNGIITTIAGNGTQGYSGDNGSASAAMLNFPIKIALDKIGNLYIADSGNDRIRKVNTIGIISTAVGNGSRGYAGDHSLAIDAKLAFPCGVAFDSLGNMFISESINNCIRKVDVNGIITTAVGYGSAGYWGDNNYAIFAQLSAPSMVVFDSKGNLYIADRLNYRVRKVWK